ncbi:hypothetical protein [Arthrobacter sp. KBS0703]|uniref:hypothetical protein n=1 Tax=Arthrobacter sp. KBS0703 TaxID=1955698 RepID=UPI00163D579D|nr:hypothetical protein [Arthrobacter sp. KBS0703]
MGPSSHSSRNSRIAPAPQAARPAVRAARRNREGPVRPASVSYTHLDVYKRQV